VAHSKLTFTYTQQQQQDKWQCKKSVSVSVRQDGEKIVMRENTGVGSFLFSHYQKLKSLDYSVLLVGNRGNSRILFLVHFVHTSYLCSSSTSIDGTGKLVAYL
jgi:hypothetical protein